MYYTGLLQECTDYNQSINDFKQYRNNITNNWGIVRKKDGEEVYAIIIHPSVTSSLSMVDNLDGWNSVEE